MLFAGTPCQVAGLKSYLGKDYNNLITIDLICHGVPSPSFFKGYIGWLERKLGATIIDFKFRSKEKGWRLTGKIAYRKNGRVKERLILPIESCYYYYFLKGDIYRESCYECPYASPNRPGDFTIGDYWGIDRIHPEVDTKNGVSLILVNSKKGLQLIDGSDFLNTAFDSDKRGSKVNDYLYLIESSFERARQYNGQLNYPTPRSKKRDVILKILREKGFQAVADKYYSEVKIQIIIYKIKTIIPNPVKDTIKKFLKKT